MEKANAHDGHRKRLIEKMKKRGLTEEEILEVLLFCVFKRRNTNDLAHGLLGKFGSLRALFRADMEELMQVDGIGESAAIFLRTLGECNELASGAKREVKAFVGDEYNAEEFTEYVKGQYESLPEEVLDFYLLDKNGDILFRRRFQGNETSAELDPTEFAKMILEHMPSGLIAVHNHPSGHDKPSQKDEEMTRICQLACSFHNVLFCDHIIVAKKGVYSYYAAGRMKDICRQYSVGVIGKKAGAAHNYKDERIYDYPAVFRKNLDTFTLEYVEDKYVGVFKDEV